MTDTTLYEIRASRQAELDRLFAEFSTIEHLTTTEFDNWRWRVGRTNAPALLYDAWYGAKITTETLTTSIGSVWSLAEYPDRCLDRDTWLELFGESGFTVDGARAPLPKGPVELWRGSVPERRTDWSWSTDRAVAERFAAGVRGRQPGRLYRVLAPSGWLLCANTGRGEAEYVIDTDGLDIKEVHR